MSKGRGAYSGSVKKLLASVDIGTTFTAVSFSILEPGDVPTFNEIQRWPKQANPDAKVPSVILYDQQGRARAHGAETDDEDVLENAETEGWRKASWWKLHLRPAHLSIIPGLTLPPLPIGVSVDKVFNNYLAYVKTQLQQYITDQFGEGGAMWEALFPSMDVILTAPNGWEIQQHQRMRTAAQSSGLVSGRLSGKRVHFVSEAEAAVLFALNSGCVGEWVQTDAELILCDCGGGTIDIASYKITGIAPLKLDETSAAACYCAGAIFVTEACKEYITEHLKGSEYGSKEAIERAVQNFEKSAKRKFEDVDSTSWIELSGFRNVPALGIRNGKLKLSGSTVASFFSRSLTQIKLGLEKAYRDSGFAAKKVILVGGLASSPYVYRELQSWGSALGLSVSRPDGPTSKAVANGALAWFLDNSVTTRVNKYHYGTAVLKAYQPFDTEVACRRPFLDVTGELQVTGAWSSIVAKDVRIEGGREYYSSYNLTRSLSDRKNTFSVRIWVYRWEQPGMFITLPDDASRPYPGFDVLCTIEANVRNLWEAAPVSQANGKQFKTIHFDICLAFGETELTARVRWEENGIQKYGKATIAQRSLVPDAL